MQRASRYVLGRCKATQNGEGGEDYFDRRTKKNKTRSDHGDVRAVPLKMFATDGIERDPVAVCNFCFVRKRPEEMNQDDSRFYLVPGGEKHF